MRMLETTIGWGVRMSILFLAMISWRGFAAADDLVATLKSGLAQQAGKVVEFSGSMEYWTAYSPYDPSEASYPIEKTSYASVTTTVSMSGSPLILHNQHPLGCSITDPTYPKGQYCETFNTFTYNGSFWIKMENNSDHAVLSKEPQSFIQPYVTGLAYVAPFCRIEACNNESLVEVLADKRAVFHASKVKINGEELICLDFSRPEYNPRETVLLDPVHGYALREHKITYLNQSYTDPGAGGKECTVAGYVAAGNGVWLPKKVEDELKADGAVCIRITFNVEKARPILNHTMEELTAVPIPKGWRVDDQRVVAARTLP
jgi:hypothetical protein